LLYESDVHSLVHVGALIVHGSTVLEEPWPPHISCEVL